MESKELVNFVAQKIFEKKGFNVIELNLQGHSPIADYFVLASANSERQVVAIAEYLIGELKDARMKPRNIEGLQEGKWALIDTGDVIIHIFQDYLRDFYDLEGLWGHVPRRRLQEQEAIASNA